MSVVIPTVGRTQPLSECIESVLRQTLLPMEIVIIDCSAERQALQVLAQYSAKGDALGVSMRHVHSCVANVCVQRNLGVSEARGDIVCFLDDDVVLQETYLFTMLETFRSYPEVVGVGGFVFSPKSDRSLKLWFKRVFLMNHDHGSGTMQRSGFPAMQLGRRDVQGPVSTRLLMGCACYKREAIIECGGFDEELGVTHLWEDIDLPCRMSRSGRLLYVPEAQMIHKHSPGGRMSLTRYAACYMYNHFYLFNKHVPHTAVNWLCFIWSHIGSIIYMMTLGLISKSPAAALRGVCIGNLWIVERILTGRRPTYDVVAKV